MVFLSFVQGMEPSSYCPFHWVKEVEGGFLINQASHAGGVVSILALGDAQTRVLPARSRMVIWQLPPS